MLLGASDPSHSPRGGRSGPGKLPRNLQVLHRRAFRPRPKPCRFRVRADRGARPRRKPSLHFVDPPGPGPRATRTRMEFRHRRDMAGRSWLQSGSSPYLFDAEIPFVYAWPLAPDPADQQNAEKVCGVAERLYQLGRGIDMAWAWGEMLDDGGLEDFLVAYPGQIYRPSENGSGRMLPKACPGSLESLIFRFQAYRERFFYREEGKTVKVVFRQPPKPRFQLTPYDSPPSRQMYELCDPVEEGVFVPWPLERAHELVVALRDAAVSRLKVSMPARAADIDRVLVGRKPDGTNDCP